MTTKASAPLSGTFQLAFDGETTEAINAAASAEEVRSALESLSRITTTVVSRDYAVTPIGDDTGAADLDLTFGSQTAECSNGEACGQETWIRSNSGGLSLHSDIRELCDRTRGQRSF